MSVLAPPPPSVRPTRRRWPWAFAGLALLPLTPYCALPRAAESGAPIATLPSGPFCAAVACDPVVADGVRFHGGGGCRFCPETVRVRVLEDLPSLDAEWGFVGTKLVGRRVEQTGCGASGCDYTLTAWWWQGGHWVEVTGQDGETDDLFGAGPPFVVTWGAVAATCGALVATDSERCR